MGVMSGQSCHSEITHFKAMSLVDVDVYMQMQIACNKSARGIKMRFNDVFVF